MSDELWDLEPRTSNTEQELWSNALDYFRWCKTNPITYKKTAMSGKTAGTKYEVEAPRMLSMKGFCLFANVLEEYIQDIWTSKDKTSLYYIVVTRIMYHIHEQNMTYAALDVFNPILVSKIHALEKEEVPSGSITIEYVRDLPPLRNSEIEVLKELESEMKLFPKDED